MATLDFYYRNVLGRRLQSSEMDWNNQLYSQAYDTIVNVSASVTATANFKGNWSALTGPLNVPASVFHSGSYWMLLSNLADVTAATPGVSGSWQLLPSGNVQGPVSVTDAHLALFDGVTGKLLKSAGKGVPAGILADTSSAQAFTNKDMSGAGNTFPATLATTAATREKLAADRTYYVRTDGSNSNNGLANTSGGAFLTIQKAVDVAATLDFGGFTVTVQVGAGTYTGATTLKSMVGQASPTNFVINGDQTTPSNVVISTTSASCFTASGPTVNATIRGVKMQAATLGFAVDCSNGAYVQIGKCHFGACASAGLQVNGATMALESSSAITIAGSMPCFVVATTGAKFTAQSVGTITLTGTPAFSTAFAYCENTSTMRILGNTFSGSGTGARYAVLGNGVIFTNAAGSTYFPGSVAGTTASGGQYL